jgi:hypothetical protein
MAEQCALHWLPHLKSRGGVPSWAVGYESLLSQVQRYDVAAQDNEEDEDTALDYSEENGLDFDGDEDDIESAVDEDEEEYFNFDE